MAVYVETTDSLSEDAKKRLTRNLTLARQLGAEVIIRSGSDVAATLLEVARQNNVSQICVGKPSGNPFWEWLRGRTLIHQLIQKCAEGLVLFSRHVVKLPVLDGAAGKTTIMAEHQLPHAVFGRVRKRMASKTPNDPIPAAPLNFSAE